MYHRTISLFLTMIAIVLAPIASAATMRCHDGIVSSGDTALVVLEKCGEPASRKRVNPAVDLSGNIVEGAASIEYWIYGPSNGMSNHLRFIDGRLVEIRSQR